MAKTKTTYTGENVTDFINSYVDNEQNKAESFRLIELMQEWSSAESKMWGSTIIGFATTITNMLADTKAMPQFLAFHREKQRSRSTFILIRKKVNYY